MTVTAGQEDITGGDTGVTSRPRAITAVGPIGQQAGKSTQPSTDTIITDTCPQLLMVGTPSSSNAGGGVAVTILIEALAKGCVYHAFWVGSGNSVMFSNSSGTTPQTVIQPSGNGNNGKDGGIIFARDESPKVDAGAQEQVSIMVIGPDTPAFPGMP